MTKDRERKRNKPKVKSHTTKEKPKIRLMDVFKKQIMNQQAEDQLGPLES
jgi:hypothetical protein